MACAPMMATSRVYVKRGESERRPREPGSLLASLVEPSPRSGGAALQRLERGRRADLRERHERSIQSPLSVNKPRGPPGAKESYWHRTPLSIHQGPCSELAMHHMKADIALGRMPKSIGMVTSTSKSSDR